MSTRSMTDIAYEYVGKRKTSVPFAKIWAEVVKTTGLSNDHIAQFYSDLTLDPRFVSMKDNKWVLRERVKYEDSHIDLSEIELLDDEDESETEGSGQEDMSTEESDY